MLLRPLLLAAAVLVAAGCDQLGLESASAVAEKRLAEGKAVGGACRHAGRAIEDCYTLNRKTDKSAIYAGWREMDDYMRENKLATVAPQLTPPEARARNADAEEAAPEEGASKPAKGEAAKGEAAKGEGAKGEAARSAKPEKLAKADARSEGKAEKAEKAAPAGHGEAADDGHSAASH